MPFEKMIHILPIFKSSNICLENTPNSSFIESNLSSKEANKIPQNRHIIIGIKVQ